MLYCSAYEGKLEDPLTVAARLIALGGKPKARFVPPAIGKEYLRSRIDTLLVRHKAPDGERRHKCRVIDSIRTSRASHKGRRWKFRYFP